MRWSNPMQDISGLAQEAGVKTITSVFGSGYFREAYSITSSARAKTAGGISSPIRLAALRLMMSS